ncbi:hypothetical protein LY622_15370 [Halomonas sp. M5N1S17]|uniref:hypothetical protein n=1 Tax=Halomonas alkalisoli TaxID=2907158 RepID=UPI001F302EEB|nr:hypothetical protein [Halomonas alkalisoli]MCE9664820.1 hypothetical protein [Halomonas alkalisoli]
MLLLILLLLTSSAQAQGGWQHLGYSQGMSASQVVSRLDQLGYEYTQNCVVTNACSVTRRRGGNVEFLSFRFCETNGVLKDMWFSPSGQSLMTFADALDEYRTRYEADVIEVDTNRYTSTYAETGERLSNAVVVVYLANQTMLEEGWKIALSVTGQENSQRFSALSTTVTFLGKCN